MPLNNIPTLEDITKISQLLSENSLDNENITIVISVPNYDLLNRINEDLFYRNGGEGSIERIDGINIHINNINFKYVIKK